MVITLRPPRLVVFLANALRLTPTLLTWLLLLAVMAFVAYSYVDNPKDGPYGVCYESRGRPIPCELQKKK